MHVINHSLAENENTSDDIVGIEDTLQNIQCLKVSKTTKFSVWGAVECNEHILDESSYADDATTSQVMNK